MTTKAHDRSRSGNRSCGRRFDTHVGDTHVGQKEASRRSTVQACSTTPWGMIGGFSGLPLWG